MAIHELADKVREVRLLCPPGVLEVNLLAARCNRRYFSRVAKYVFNLLRKIVCVPEFKKDQGLLVEVVRNARRSGRNHRFSKSKVFEDARRGVDFREDVSLIRNDADVAGAN